MKTTTMRFLLALVMVAMPLAGQEVIYDLLLKNGHVIDPANARNGIDLKNIDHKKNEGQKNQALFYPLVIQHVFPPLLILSALS